MAREPRPLDGLLSDIVSWGERIQTFVAGLSFDDFAGSDLHQLAVIKCIEAIGEAAGSVRKHHPDFVAAHPEIEFEAAYRARNRLSHGYDTIDIAIVWPAATESVPELVQAVRTVLREMSA
jgi:uncharacterized protein with HEPN domain